MAGPRSEVDRPITGSQGPVTRIGGLAAKARAARPVGVDVFFSLPDGRATSSNLDPGTMRQVPVATLEEVIDFLAGA